MATAHHCTFPDEACSTCERDTDALAEAVCPCACHTDWPDQVALTRTCPCPEYIADVKAGTLDPIVRTSFLLADPNADA